MYKYYSTQRPIGLGTIPQPDGNRVVEVKNFDSREYVEATHRPAWGWVVYQNPLTKQQADSYELVPENISPFPLVEEYMEQHNFLEADRTKVRNYLREVGAVSAMITRTEVRYKDRMGVIGKIGRGQLGIQDNVRL